MKDNAVFVLLKTLHVLIYNIKSKENVLDKPFVFENLKIGFNFSIQMKE